MSTTLKALPLILLLAVMTQRNALAKPADLTDNANLGDWDKVWRAVQSPGAGLPIPVAATQEGPPRREGARVLFRLRAPDAAQAYLAGSFNDWARNRAGKVADSHFAMQRAGNGFWFKLVDLAPQVQQYKFVTEDKNGAQKWLPDPNVPSRDRDGNTVFDFSTLPAPAQLLSRRALKPLTLPIEPVVPAIEAQAERVWVRPNEPNTLLVTLGTDEAEEGSQLSLSLETPLGQSFGASSQACKPGENRVPIPALNSEGGYLAKLSVSRAGRVVARGQTILSVVANVADDLRYGFYASYGKVGGDYDAKSAMLARLHVNAVEFYDYFPAHGYYAPRETEYKFEPFGVAINALDIQRKIEAGHRSNILSLAYVAAYAASKSVYRQHPDPMTDENGSPKVFNGAIMSEAEADRTHKDKWFWLMNVAADSSWHRYILSEFERTLDDKPGDLVSFDGFEIDTYGDNANTKFYAQGSRRSGDLLRDVLHDFVGDVHSLTQRIKPHGLVSFNSVNEFGAGQMADVSDFLFLEIWRAHTDKLEDLVDICVRNREARRQRVILKMYPADMNPAQTQWPEYTLRRLLGATMTGAGSLMVVGEPDEQSHAMHALNTLYYPDRKPVPSANEEILRAYYNHDALLLGYTHGRGVENTSLDYDLPGCITRTYAAPDKHALIVQLLQTGPEPRWSIAAAEPEAKKNSEVSLPLPGGISPKSVYFVTPDVAALQTPVKLDFDSAGGTLRILLPELRVHGTLILNYSAE